LEKGTVAYVVRPSVEPAAGVGQLETEAILLVPTDVVMYREGNFLDTAYRP
jgi:hypothetical protein